MRDLDRVFRQVHRVMRPGGQFLLSVPHPAALCVDSHNDSRVSRSWATGEPVGDRWVHTAEEIVTSLGRANFAVNNLLERHDGGPMPATLVVRAHKQMIRPHPDETTTLLDVGEQPTQ